MPSTLIIYLKQGEHFDAAQIERSLKLIDGVSGIGASELADSLIACFYEFDGYRVIVRVDSDPEAIYVSNDSIAALNFALELQKLEKQPLRIMNDSGTYHFSLGGVKSLKQLKHKAFEQGCFDEGADSPTPSEQRGGIGVLV